MIHSFFSSESFVLLTGRVSLYIFADGRLVVFLFGFLFVHKIISVHVSRRRQTSFFLSPSAAFSFFPFSIFLSSFPSHFFLSFSLLSFASFSLFLSFFLSSCFFFLFPFLPSPLYPSFPFNLFLFSVFFVCYTGGFLPYLNSVL